MSKLSSVPSSHRIVPGKHRHRISRQVRECSFSRKGLGTQDRDVSDNEDFHFMVLSVRGSRAVKPRRVLCRPGKRFWFFLSREVRPCWSSVSPCVQQLATQRHAMPASLRVPRAFREQCRPQQRGVHCGAGGTATRATSASPGSIMLTRWSCRSDLAPSLSLPLSLALLVISSTPDRPRALPSCARLSSRLCLSRSCSGLCLACLAPGARDDGPRCGR